MQSLSKGKIFYGLAVSINFVFVIYRWKIFMSQLYQQLCLCSIQREDVVCHICINICLFSIQMEIFYVLAVSTNFVFVLNRWKIFYVLSVSTTSSIQCKWTYLMSQLYQQICLCSMQMEDIVCPICINMFFFSIQMENIYPSCIKKCCHTSTLFSFFPI